MRQEYRRYSFCRLYLKTQVPQKLTSSLASLDSYSAVRRVASCIDWQARRDSNPQPPDLESGALTVRATGLQVKLYIMFSPCDVKKNMAANGRTEQCLGKELVFKGCMALKKEGDGVLFL